MDRGTLLRSHRVGDLGFILHSKHQYHWHTGYAPPQPVPVPHMGSWIAKILGPRKPDVPAFVNIGQNLEIGAESDSVKAYTTSGVWVVVEGTAEARYETLSLTSADWLSKAGVRYALTDRIPATIEMLPGDVNQPGLPRRALLVFEMPQDTVAGGSVAVTRSKLSPLDDEVHIATDADTDRTEPKITLRRNNEGFPWTVLPQQ